MFNLLASLSVFFFFFNDTATTEIYTLSLHDALPITLRILEWGDVHVELAHQLKSLLNSPHISKSGFLSGAVAGSIGIKDAARRPYYLGLSLKLRNGNVLTGVVTARADESGVAPTYGLFPSVGGRPPPDRVQTEVFILAQWAELTRQ